MCQTSYKLNPLDTESPLSNKRGNEEGDELQLEIKALITLAKPKKHAFTQLGPSGAEWKSNLQSTGEVGWRNHGTVWKRSRDK